MRFQKGDIVPVEVILNELLTPTDEMIEAMAIDWFGGFNLGEGTMVLVRGPLKSAFRSAIQKALES